MKILFLAPTLFCAIWCSGIRAEPTTAPVGGGEVLRIDGHPARIAATCDWSDLIQLRSTGGRLIVDISLPDSIAQALAPPAPHGYVRIRQSPDPWSMSFDHGEGKRGVPGGWNINATAGRLDGPEIAGFHSRRILKLPGHFQMVGEGKIGDRTVRAEFYLIGPQDDPRAQLTIADPVGDDKEPRIIQCESFSQMLSKYPLDVRRYVSPMLDEIAGKRVIKPGAADIYRAFDAIQPDEKTIAQVRALITDLGAPDSNRRKAATAKLNELGAPAVLVMQRMDHTSLSPEQQSRVSKLIAENTTGIAREAARKDALFLADALCDDDRQVRVAARDALAKLTGKPVDFDVDQNPQARKEAADRLTESILKSTSHR